MFRRGGCPEGIISEGEVQLCIGNPSLLASKFDLLVTLLSKRWDVQL